MKHHHRSVPAGSNSHDQANRLPPLSEEDSRKMFSIVRNAKKLLEKEDTVANGIALHKAKELILKVSGAGRRLSVQEADSAVKTLSLLETQLWLQWDRLDNPDNSPHQKILNDLDEIKQKLEQQTADLAARAAAQVKASEEASAAKAQAQAKAFEEALAAKAQAQAVASAKAQAQEEARRKKEATLEIQRRNAAHARAALADKVAKAKQVKEQPKPELPKVQIPEHYRTLLNKIVEPQPESKEVSELRQLKVMIPAEMAKQIRAQAMLDERSLAATVTAALYFYLGLRSLPKDKAKSIIHELAVQPAKANI